MTLTELRGGCDEITCKIVMAVLGQGKRGCYNSDYLLRVCVFVG